MHAQKLVFSPFLVAAGAVFVAFVLTMSLLFALSSQSDRHTLRFARYFTAKVCPTAHAQ